MSFFDVIRYVLRPEFPAITPCTFISSLSFLKINLFRKYSRQVIFALFFRCVRSNHGVHIKIGFVIIITIHVKGKIWQTDMPLTVKNVIWEVSRWTRVQTEYDFVLD